MARPCRDFHKFSVFRRWAVILRVDKWHLVFILAVFTTITMTMSSKISTEWIESHCDPCAQWNVVTENWILPISRIIELSRNNKFFDNLIQLGFPLLYRCSHHIYTPETLIFRRIILYHCHFTACDVTPVRFYNVTLWISRTKHCHIFYYDDHQHLEEEAVGTCWTSFWRVKRSSTKYLVNIYGEHYSCVLYLMYIINVS